MIHVSLIRRIRPEEIVNLRRTFRWSQKDLAEEIGVAPLSIIEWEKGMVSPKKNSWKLKYLLEVAAVLEKTRKQIKEDEAYYRFVQNIQTRNKFGLAAAEMDQHEVVALLKEGKDPYREARVRIRTKREKEEK